MKDPFRAIAEFTYDWESWISPDGELRWVNGAVERITGYSVAECMTMADYPLSLVHSLDRPAVAAVLLQARLGQPGNHFEFRVLRKDGDIRWAAISWQPITVDGQDVGFRSSVRDIDEHKRMEQELHAAMRRAEEANHAKTHFLANVTHELRTPLQSIIGYGQLMLNSDVPEPVRTYATTVVQQSEQLEHLVSDLLDFSALQAGMLRVRMEPFDVVDVVSRVVQSLQPLASKRGLRLESIIGAHGTIIGDAHRLTQVLTNVISNAIKYTPAGCVCVSTSTSADSELLQICVDDTGPGLPPEVEVFEPFHQGPQPSVHRGGVGLGLALSRQLCARMGGRLEAESSKLGGARLVVTLPLTLTPLSAVAHIEPQEVITVVDRSFAKAYPLSVLVIDDVEPAREFLVAALEALGYSPLAAASADLAFGHAERRLIDAALVDIQMPDVDGWTTARGLRARLGAAPYLVALTAQASADDPVRLSNAGFDTFASKPLKMAGLQRLLMQAFQHKRKGLETAVVFDAERWKEMAAIMTASGESLLDVMRNRVVAALPDVIARIETASQAGQGPALRRAIHDANGLFGLIGASFAQLLATECEGTSDGHDPTPTQLEELTRTALAVVEALETRT
jgi:two-component system, sensor histidine kinase